MLTSTLSFTNGAATNTFVTTSISGNDVSRMATEIVAPDKVEMRVAHTKVGKVGARFDSHLIQFVRTAVSGSVKEQATLNLTIKLPENATVVGASQVRALINYLVDMLCTGTQPTLDTAMVDSILRGES